jgi:ankyrin repeat protein
MAKRNAVEAVQWLLDHGADPDAGWWHWDAEVTPLHLAAAHGHAEVVRLLLQAGADPGIRDSKHEGDAIGWAGHFGQPEIVRILEDHAAAT